MRLLNEPTLEAANNILTEGIDLDEFLKSQRPGGGMAGSDRLDWPDKPKQTLGLSLLLIQKFARDSHFLLQFSHTYYNVGRKIIGDIHAVVGQLIIPFVREMLIPLTQVALDVVS